MKMLALAALALLIALPAVVSARPADDGGTDRVVVIKKHPPTRLRVRPLYPRRNVNSPYPPANAVDYPGPNAHRECTGALVVEHRPSGTVIVPRRNCRWAPGFYPGP